MRSHGRHRLPRRLAAVSTILLVGALVPMLGGASAAQVPNGGFEIDGNLVTATPGADWGTLGYGPQTDGTGSADPSVYQTSSKEDDWPNWVAGTGAPPGKSDIGKYYWHESLVEGHQWAYFAWDRGKGQGTEYYFLELNQKANSSNTPAIPNRTVGDLRVTIHDHGNGTIDVLRVDKWNGGDWAQLAPPAGSWDLATNDAVIPASGLPFGTAFPDKQDGSLGEEQFIELSLDLTAMNVVPACPSAFMTVNFRSVTGNAGKVDSGSPDAQFTEDDMVGKNLKDYVAPITTDINNCANLTIKKVDQDGTTPLAGVKFSVTPNPATGTGDVTVTTGADGTYDFPQTVPGIEYTVHEVAAPTGYVAAADQNVKPDPYAVVTLTFVDKHVLTDLTVKKVDATTEAALGGAKFALWMESNGKDGLQMTDVGATKADTAVENGTCTTAGDGTCTVKDLDFGTYYWQEVAPPAGYRMPVKNVSDAIVVTAANAGTTVVTTFEDEAQVGALAITKANSPTETESVDYGDTITYTLTVTASGDATQHNVVVTDVIPGYDDSYPTSGKTTYVAGSGTCVSGATCTATYDATTHTLTWEVGDMTAATPVTVSFKVTVDAVAADATGAVPAETIWNAGNVKSEETEVQPSNAVKNPVTAVQGEKQVKPPTEVQGETQHLPFTGAPIPALLAAAFALVGTGLAMARVRRGRTS